MSWNAPKPRHQGVTIHHPPAVRHRRSSRPSQLTHAPKFVDVAVIGFGFSGLNVVGQLARLAPQLRVAVVGDDLSGHGLAYGTRDSHHLLNVVAARMGFGADDPSGFARWLITPAGVQAAREVGVDNATGFLPRYLYARYLTAIRDEILARQAGRLDLIHGRAATIRRTPGGWRIEGPQVLDARACVLATGHEPRHVFGAFKHPALHAGPWKLPPIPDDGRPVVLVGSGLTAVDAILTLRSQGHRGRIIAVSRNGRMPIAHTATAPPLDVSASTVDELRTVSAIVAFIRHGSPDGGWRARLDCPRPHTVRIWQRLDARQQRVAMRRWSGIWGVHRHRMAPSVARRIDDELDRSVAEVSAVASLNATAVEQELVLRYTPRGTGTQESLRPAAVIDCTGSQLNYGANAQPLFQSLIGDGQVRTHHTGVGLAADEHHRVAPQMYALGPPLVGQRWESIAAPEIRESADAIARTIRKELGEPNSLGVGRRSA